MPAAAVRRFGFFAAATRSPSSLSSVAVDLLLELGEDLCLLLLHVVADAGGEHRHRGAESRLVDEPSDLGQAFARETVLDPGLFRLFLADHALHDRVDVALLDLHVQLERLRELVDGLAPAAHRASTRRASSTSARPHGDHA